MTSFAEVMEKARAAGPARFVVAQAADGTILQALAEAEKGGFARPILVGRREEIEKAARESGTTVSGWQIVDAAPAEAAAQAVRVVSRGEGDILVKGLLQSAEVLRAVLHKSDGLSAGRTLSHVGVFRFPEPQTVLLRERRGTHHRPELAAKGRHRAECRRPGAQARNRAARRRHPLCHRDGESGHAGHR